MSFVHLHVHTQYSILDGLSDIKGLFARARELGMPAVAITDHGNMYGVKEFFKHAYDKKNKDEDGKLIVRPIIGCEVYVTRHYDHHLKDTEHRGYYHLILLAKNYEGYRNLMKIVSTGHIEGKYYDKPRVSHEVLEQYHENLICCSACLAGEVPKDIMAGDLDGARKAIEWHKNLFGEDYYLEVMYHPTRVSDVPAEVYAKIREVPDNQEIVNKAIFALADELGVKVVATNDAHFLRREDGPVHDRLICLTTNASVDDPKRMRYTQEEYIKSEEEMAALFPDHPEVLENTLEVASKVEDYSIDRDHVLPKYEIDPAFMASIDEHMEKYADVINEGNYSIKKDKKSGEEISRTYRGDAFCHSVAYLCHLTYEGARKRYGEPLSAEQQERIDFELKTICRMGFPDYFLIVQDYIAASRKEGWMVGPGRGSAAGSVVAYCLGITNLDPIRYNLLFERFLNPDRISMPDIDVDFENLPASHDYVERTYGADHVSRVITFGKMLAKGAIKDVARISNLSLDESARLAKMVPDHLSEKQEKEYPFNPKLDELKSGFKAIEKEDGKWTQKGLEDTDVPVTLENCFRLVPEFKNELENGTDLCKEVLFYAQKLEGSIRQVGMHACATIIGRGNLTDYIPICLTKDKDSGKELWTSQYDGHYIEDVGMLKMDFLGLNTLSIIKECLRNVKHRHGLDIDIEAIPIDDKEVFELYSRGDTTSVFQFESPGMKEWLQKLHPERFEDLIAMNALYRPGPMDYIPDFVDRKLGRKEIEYDLDDMAEFLSETYGITVYQEQVMQLSRKLASFTKGEADKLRKAMGKKQIAVMQELKEKFMNNGVGNGYPEKTLDKIWKDWEKFAQYAFNKSHATCYAWVSYQTAWLKTHYRAEFEAANLSLNLSNMDEIKKVMADSRKAHVKVLSPDVNESESGFTVNAAGEIRFGLGGIKGFGDNVVQAILKERDEGGLFTDIYDFVERMSKLMNKRNFENLLYAGAFDSFGYPREQYAMVCPSGDTFIDAMVRYAEGIASDDFDQSASLFGDAEELRPVKPQMPQLTGEVDPLERLRREKELVGMYLSSHPLDVYRQEIELFTTAKCSQVPQLIADAQESKKPCEVCIAGYVSTLESKTAINGKPYARATLEDFDGQWEVRLNGKVYEKFIGVFKEHNSLLLEGRIDEQYFRKPEERKTQGDPPYSFRIDNVTMLGNVSDTRIRELRLSITLEALTEKFRGSLVKLLRAYKGKSILGIYVSDTSVEGGSTVELQSHKARVHVCADLCEALDAMGVAWKIIKN